MPSLKRKIMREYTRVTYNNAEISERDTEFLECWENPAHAQTVCTRPSLSLWIISAVNAGKLMFNLQLSCVLSLSL